VIAKVRKGQSFGGLLRYLYGPGREEAHSDPHMVGGNLALADRPRLIADELRQVAAGNERVQRPVFHVSLRLPDHEQLSDEQWRQVGERFVVQMGFVDADAEAPWAIIRHDGQAGRHAHIVASRVREDGSCVDDRHDYRRAHAACRVIEAEHGLTVVVPSVDRLASVSRGERDSAQRRGVQPERARLRQAIEQARDSSDGTRADFEARAAAGGVLLRANQASTGRMNGYSVSLQGWQDAQGEQVWLTASKVHKTLSWSRLGPDLSARAETASADVDQVQNLADVDDRQAQNLPEAQDRVDEPEASPEDPDNADQAHQLVDEAAAAVSLADVHESQAPQLVGDELASVIGEPAAARLEAQARAQAAELSDVDGGQLAARTVAGRQALDQLDPEGARDTLDVQRLRASAAAHIVEEQQAAQRLREEADQHTGWRSAARLERGALHQAADEHQHEADMVQREVPRWAADEQRLRDEGRHLDDWLTQHGPTVADGLAAEREQARRTPPKAPASAAGDRNRPGRDADVDVDEATMAAAAEIDRLTAANFPTPARGGRPPPSPTSPAARRASSAARRAPPQRPGRDSDLSR